MRIYLLLHIVVFFLCATGTAQTTDSKEADYIRTINSRAQKIVATLNINDSAKFYRVQSIVANQYKELNDLHTQRDEVVKKIKGSEYDSSAKRKSIEEIQKQAQAKIDELHNDYLNKLLKELTDAQVTKVKDGMTYNVLNVTYNGYMDMLPNLTTEQKSRIMTWLVEAREHAMDAESSEKKHGWFGKYKGRINNYLSAAGYDLKKETEAWQQRIKERAQKKTTSTN